jgi:hypothetical protein
MCADSGGGSCGQARVSCAVPVRRLFDIERAVDADRILHGAETGAAEAAAASAALAAANAVDPNSIAGAILLLAHIRTTQYTRHKTTTMRQQLTHNQIKTSAISVPVARTLTLDLV